MLSQTFKTDVDAGNKILKDLQSGSKKYTPNKKT